MIQFKNPFRGIKVEYARSSPVTKIVVIAVILVCMAALIVLRLTGYSLKNEIADLRNEAIQLEVENEKLEDLVEDPDSIEGVENAAEDELGLVDPDTIVIDPNP